MANSSVTTKTLIALLERYRALLNTKNLKSSDALYEQIYRDVPLTTKLIYALNMENSIGYKKLESTTFNLNKKAGTIVKKNSTNSNKKTATSKNVITKKASTKKPATKKVTTKKVTARKTTKKVVSKKSK
jgi:hypothetical protein